MSVFHIPELFDLIRLDLSKQDLVRCSAVNKSWNAAFSSYLWQSVPTEIRPDVNANMVLGPYTRKWDRFRPLIEEDILYTLKQQQHTVSEDHRKDDSNNFAIPALSRNGHWIRTIFVDQHVLLRPYQPQPYQITSLPPLDPAATFTTMDTAPSVQRHRHQLNHNPQLATPELLLHLLQRCPNLHTLQIQGRDKLAAEYYFWKRIISHGFSDNLKDLHIILHPSVSLAKSTISTLLLNRCPLGLQKLTLNIDHRGFRGGSEGADVDTKEDEVRTPLPALTDLTVSYTGEWCPPLYIRFLERCFNLESIFLKWVDSDWIWALKSCPHLKRLAVLRISSSCLSILARAVMPHLPSLDTFHIHYDSNFSSDYALELVLRACDKGWKSLHIPYLGKLSVEALIQHCSTLEELDVCVAKGLTSQKIRHILSTSSRLVKFRMLSTANGHAEDRTHIMAEDFIDLDSALESVRPWQCESTLKVFSARISGIPRPGVTRIAREKYPGQRNDLQQQIYERLARFTNLELLELGHQSFWTDRDREWWSPSGQEVLDEWGNHVDCLDMSLASGLRKLKGLKKLRKVCVISMSTSIGVEEVQWMAQNWLKLEAVHGLRPHGRRTKEFEAVEWLRANHPCIGYYYRCYSRD
ncbi:hypothetical protein BGZ96_012808 [Linnemannia gamsii]|uniref:F-box domain-containing protein n=1 Tax=Linnemannia gamsii TaxID=64522 RepID=A0ABQ7JPQ9_9FUNG|nr:hypothetical protein BGZ96_012808 [Linnemannia gamsii]